MNPLPQPPAPPRAPAPQPQPQPQPPAPSWIAQNRGLIAALGILLILFCCLCLGLTALAGYAFTRSTASAAPIVSTTPYAPPAVAPPAVPAGFPQTEQEVINAIYVACPSNADCIDVSVGEIHECAGEPRGTCWATTREKDQNAHIVPFWGTNPFSCQQDGYRGSPALGYGGTGVPSGYTGRLEGMTLRPCR